MDGAPQKPKHEPIDYFDPLIVMAFITAFVGDLLSILIIPHYFAAFIVVGILWSRVRGLLAKLVLIAAFIIPVPGTLIVGVFLSILLSNKFIAALAEQVGVGLLAVATGGAGLAAEGAVAGTEGVTVAAEGIQAAAAVAEVGAGAAATAEAGVSAVTGEVAAGVGGAGVGVSAAGEAAEGVQSVGGATEEVAGEVGEEAAEKSTESIKNKAIRKLKEKFKEKVREKIEQGFGGDEDQGEYEPTQQEIDEEIKRQQELDRALGEPEPIMEGLERGLFAEAPPFNRSNSNKVVELQLVRKAPVVNIADQRKAPKSKPTTQDILAKSEDKQAQFRKNRQDSDQDSGGVNRMAA